MKQLLFSALLLAGASQVRAQGSTAVGAASAAQVGTLSALDAKNGLLTYTLGAPLSDYPQLKRKAKDVYENPKEPRTLADVPLTSLGFTGYKGRLASITFGTQGAGNIEKLLALLMREYGPSTSANGALQSWVGNKATLYVSRVGSGDYELCLVTLKSNELAAQQKAAAK